MKEVPGRTSQGRRTFVLRGNSCVSVRIGVHVGTVRNGAYAGRIIVYPCTENEVNGCGGVGLNPKGDCIRPALPHAASLGGG